MSSGSSTHLRTAASSGSPATAATISPNAMKPRSEYVTWVPGGATSGVEYSDASSEDRSVHHW